MSQSHSQIAALLSCLDGVLDRSDLFADCCQPIGRFTTPLLLFGQFFTVQRQPFRVLGESRLHRFLSSLGDLLFADSLLIVAALPGPTSQSGLLLGSQPGAIE